MQVFQPKTLIQNTALLGFVFFASVGIEWLQSLIGRDASWGDVGANITGTLITLFWLHRPNIFVWLGRILTLLLVLFLFSKPTFYLIEYLQLRSELPVLATFENEREMRRWSRRITRSSEESSEGEFSGKFYFNSDAYRGFGLFRIARDWSAYTQLSIDLLNPTTHNLNVSLRIEDVFIRKRWQYNNAFNKDLQLRPGWQTFRVTLNDIENGPENRKLDLKNIYSIRITPQNMETLNNNNEIAIFVDNIKLE